MDANDFRVKYDKMISKKEQEQLKKKKERERLEQEQLKKDTLESAGLFKKVNGITIEEWCDNQLQESLDECETMPLVLFRLPHKTLVEIYEEKEIKKTRFRNTVELLLVKKEIEVESAIGGKSSKFDSDISLYSIMDTSHCGWQGKDQTNHIAINKKREEYKDKCVYKGLINYIKDYYTIKGFESEISTASIPFFEDVEYVSVWLPKQLK